MRKMKKIIACMLAIGMIFVGTESTAWASELEPRLFDTNQAEAVVGEMFDAVDKQDWNKFTELIVVIIVENGTLKVVQFNRPSMELISTIVEPELSKLSTDYEEQIAGIEVLEYAEK